MNPKADYCHPLDYNSSDLSLWGSIVSFFRIAKYIRNKQYLEHIKCPYFAIPFCELEHL